MHKGYCVWHCMRFIFVDKELKSILSRTPDTNNESRERKLYLSFTLVHEDRAFANCPNISIELFQKRTSFRLPLVDLSLRFLVMGRVVYMVLCGEGGIGGRVLQKRGKEQCSWCRT